MNPIKTIRVRLSLTQAELAKALGMSQGNVAFYERGQTVPPQVAQRLIRFARDRGHDLGYEDVYGPLETSAAGDDEKQVPALAPQAPPAINGGVTQGGAHV